MKCALGSIFFYSFSTGLFGFRVRIAVWPLVWLSSTGKVSATNIRQYKEIYHTAEILFNVLQRLWITRNSYLSIQILHIALDTKEKLEEVSNRQNMKSYFFRTDCIIIRIFCKRMFSSNVENVSWCDKGLLFLANC